MAVIHRTTLTPGKLELLSLWLPGQPWYLPAGREPELGKAGGFRLDDPAGAVGIEFMVVTDGQGSRARVYQVPMTYRAGARADAAGALIGTTRHGVLGERWVYDGLRDPVLVAQLVAFLQGGVAAQAQSESHTADPTVLSSPVPGGPLAITGTAAISDEPGRTELSLAVMAGPAASTAAGRPAGGVLTLGIRRLLTARADGLAATQAGVTASWRQLDGTRVRGLFADARLTA